MSLSSCEEKALPDRAHIEEELRMTENALENPTTLPDQQGGRATPCTHMSHSPMPVSRHRAVALISTHYGVFLAYLFCRSSIAGSSNSGNGGVTTPMRPVKESISSRRNGQACMSAEKWP